MTRENLDEFFSLPQCDEHDLFIELEAQAIQCAINGEHELCSNLLRAAHGVATDKLRLKGGASVSEIDKIPSQRRTGGCDD